MRSMDADVLPIERGHEVNLNGSIQMTSTDCISCKQGPQAAGFELQYIGQTDEVHSGVIEAANRWILGTAFLCAFHRS